MPPLGVTGLVRTAAQTVCVWLGIAVIGLGLSAVSAVVSSIARADIYQFTDDDGVVHYTNVPERKGKAAWKRLYHVDKSGKPTAHEVEEPDENEDPKREQPFTPFIKEAAQLYSLPEAFLRAIVLVESNFTADVISEAGAMGLMQLMPETAKDMGVFDGFDPRQNVLGGARFLRVLANRFQGDLVLTVAAYNAGPGAVEHYRGVPPYEQTRLYVQRVMEHYYAFRQRDSRKLSAK